MSALSLHKAPLVTTVEQCLQDGHLPSIEHSLASSRCPDVFAPAVLPTTASQLFPNWNEESFDDWILNIDQWVERMEDPTHEPTVSMSVLYVLWDTFESDLTESLRRARISSGIPRSGGVLAFVAQLQKCIVVRYQFAGSWPHIHPIAVIDNPRSAFDVWTAVDNADQNARNALKDLLASGHKLVYHRGVLTHVDRRNEPTVFGPSIDTLVMAEMLAQRFYDYPTNVIGAHLHGPTSACEVGSGSGMLSAGMLRYLPALKSFTAHDIDFTALACTYKNLKLAASTPGAARSAGRHLVQGPFQHEFLGGRVSLVVCNPPYLIEPDFIRQSDEPTPDYLKAVAGLELMRSFVASLPKFLAADGVVLLMTSSLTGGALEECLPTGFAVDRPFGKEGYEVPFDVEAVLSRGAWVRELVDSGKLEKKDGSYIHRLHPVWISRAT